MTSLILWPRHFRKPLLQPRAQLIFSLALSLASIDVGAASQSWSNIGYATCAAENKFQKFEVEPTGCSGVAHGGGSCRTSSAHL